MAQPSINELTLPSQCQELLTRPDVRYIAYHGGRGSAKSHSVARALVIRGLTQPLRIGCYREIQRSIKTSVKQLLDDVIDEMGLRSAYRSTEYGIEGGADGKTKFIFGGLRSNPDSVKSTEGLDIAWVEEADRCSQASIELLTPTLRRKNSQLIFTWNRRNTTDPVDNMFLGGAPPPRSIVKQVNWRHNPWFPDDLREEMEWLKQRDRDKWLHVWEGQPLQRSEARVFNNWRVDDLDEVIPSGLTPRLGADWGFSIDPTVLVKAYRWKRTLYIADEAFKVGCPIDAIPALFAGSDDRNPPRWENPQNFKGVEGVLRNRVTADSARPETIAYLNARGFTVKSAIKGARSIEEGVSFLQAHDIVVHPRCAQTINELHLYSYKVDKLTDDVLPDLEDKNNHIMDALRYALESERRAGRGKLAIAGAESVPLNG